MVLKEFFILEKKEFLENRDFYLLEKVDFLKCILNRIGGFIGELVKFYMDREIVEWYEAVRYLGFLWWGINIGDRCLMFWVLRNDMGYVKDLKGKIKE